MIYMMLFTVAVGVPIACAAWAIAPVVRRKGTPERTVWLSALLLAVAIPVAMLSGSSAGAREQLEILAVSVGGVPVALQAFVLALWALLSGWLLLRWARSALRLWLETPDDTPTAIDGVDVQVTEDVGPAVAGLFRPHILAPGWVVALPASERSIFLVHEQEHIRGGDPWLLRVARAACTLLPWNPVVWFLSLRLVSAIERDCDRRVVRRRRSANAPGNALLEISGRGTSRPIAAATMASVVLGVSLLAGALEVPLPPVRLRVEVGQSPPAPERAALTPPARQVAPYVAGWQTRPRAITNNSTPSRRPAALRNAGLVRRRLLEEYPRELRARGIGGTVFLAVLVGPNGRPLERRLDRTSSHPALDEAALRVVDDMRFTPARRRDSQSPVWVDQQITFSPGAVDPSRFDHHAAR